MLWYFLLVAYHYRVNFGAKVILMSTLHNYVSYSLIEEVEIRGYWDRGGGGRGEVGEDSGSPNSVDHA